MSSSTPPAPFPMSALLSPVAAKPNSNTQRARRRREARAREGAAVAAVDPTPFVRTTAKKERPSRRSRKKGSRNTLLSQTVEYMENWIPVVKNELVQSGHLSAKIESAADTKSARAPKSVLGVKNLVNEVMDLSRENRLLQKELQVAQEASRELLAATPASSNAGAAANASTTTHAEANRSYIHSSSNVVGVLQAMLHDAAQRERAARDEVSDREKRLGRAKKAIQRQKDDLEKLRAEKAAMVRFLEKERKEVQRLRNAAAKAGLEVARARDEAREANSSLQASKKKEQGLIEEIKNLKAQQRRSDSTTQAAPTAAPALPEIVVGEDAGALKKELAEVKAELQAAFARALAAESSASVLLDLLPSSNLDSGGKAAPAVDLPEEKGSGSDDTLSRDDKSRRMIEELEQREREAKKQNQDLMSVNEKLRLELQSVQRERAQSLSINVSSSPPPLIEHQAPVPPPSPRKAAANRKRKGNVWSGPSKVETLSPAKTGSVAGSTGSGEEEERKLEDIPAATVEFVITALKKHFLFASMKDTELSGVVGAMKRREYKDGDTVIKQGEDGNHFYVCEKGHLGIRANGVEVAEADPGDCFGELALLHNCPRAATVEATCSVVLYELDRTSFRTALASASSKKEGHIIDALSKIELLDGLTEEDLNLLATEVSELEFQPGQVIIKKGDIGDCLYLIADGEVLCKDIGADNAKVRLKSGMYFGEMALRTESPRLATVVAETRCTLFALDRHSFKTVLGTLDDHLEENFRVRMIETVSEFDSLTSNQRKQVARSLKVADFDEFQIVIRKNQLCESIYMISEGELVVTDREITEEESSSEDWFGSWFDSLEQDEYRWYSKGDHFGSLEGSSSTVSVVSMGNVQCLSIDKPIFESLRATGAFNAQRGVPGGKLTPLVAFKLEDYKVVSDSIGTGSFSNVKLVKSNRSEAKNGDADLEVLRKEELFALKVIKKKGMIEAGIDLEGYQESKIMDELRGASPFVTNLISEGQDKENIYMLMEYFPGGELFDRLHSVGWCLWFHDAMFYGANVILAVEALHELGVVFRDLKPENLMFDEHGYLKLVDFGFAKKLSGKTFTLCGTPEYLAPETILGRGYTKSVDWWSFGVLMYDMIVGASPFAGESGDLDEVSICRNIIEQKLRFPPKTEKNTKDLIRKLLVKSPAKRLGHGRNGASDIRSHAVFNDVDWEAILEEKANTPWVPPKEKLLDFD